MNHYETLEVSQNASQEVIKAAYRSLMQRYHPDRNPGNAGAAERSLLVGRAYEVLSDPARRAAYDIELKQQLASHLIGIRVKSHDVPRRQAKADRDNESYWYLWPLIALIIFSGWFILSLSKKEQSPEAELKEIRQSLVGNQLTNKQMQGKMNRIDQIFREHPEILEKESGERAKEVFTRTVPIYITNLTVNLRDPDNSSGGSAEKPKDTSGKSSEETGHVLAIPVLGVTAGTFDAEKFMLHLEKNNEYISRKLAEKLVNARYEELVNIKGELYLKKIILDSLGEITGTNRYEDYPSPSSETPAHYGVVDVLLPESFSVH
jgi:curved DNA-binding protein CbpA